MLWSSEPCKASHVKGLPEHLQLLFLTLAFLLHSEQLTLEFWDSSLSPCYTEMEYMSWTGVCMFYLVSFHTKIHSSLNLSVLLFFLGIWFLWKKFLISLNKSVICLWCYFVVVIEVLTVTFTVCEKMSPWAVMVRSWSMAVLTSYVCVLFLLALIWEGLPWGWHFLIDTQIKRHGRKSLGCLFGLLPHCCLCSSSCSSYWSHHWLRSSFFGLPMSIKDL